MSRISSNSPASIPAKGPVIAKAVHRAADHLKLTSKVLGSIIGLSEPSISRLKKGEFALEVGTKPFELAVLLVRLYRSLDAIVGGDDEVARAWLRSENLALGGRPVDRILTVQGLVDVIAYLDARRAVI